MRTHLMETLSRRLNARYKTPWLRRSAPEAPAEDADDQVRNAIDTLKMKDADVKRRRGMTKVEALGILMDKSGRSPANVRSIMLRIGYTPEEIASMLRYLHHGQTRRR